MKKLIIGLFIVLILFIGYTDFTKGTINHELLHENDSTSSIEAEAKPGDTLISMMERHDILPVNFNIDQLSQDFTQLNQGLPPQKIVAGQYYSLPVVK
ncbi:hypothetical protein [Jeotgalibacillus campisalis]|uniref:LysM domain-containing protein n=1 Tax=Jeotgalibacillus campisalis TaxID=220754 RepID=A0A0C2VAR6_9BACL|nr:hypothetical protein [Jeotgalibacillus campisalis]KIL46007.1 hypothetical protein KR50_26820 [Jeotgalibacillus campisalis]